jgi:hypothetical protein
VLNGDVPDDGGLLDNDVAKFLPNYFFQRKDTISPDVFMF